MTALLIALAGAAGTTARWQIGLAFGPKAGAFPWSTLLVNASGSFLLGLLLTWPPAQRWPDPVLVALTFGFLGAFTTFSTFGYEMVSLVRAGRPGLAAAYATASVGVGLLAAAGGVLVGRVGV